MNTNLKLWLVNTAILFTIVFSVALVVMGVVVYNENMALCGIMPYLIYFTYRFILYIAYSIAMCTLLTEEEYTEYMDKDKMVSLMSKNIKNKIYMTFGCNRFDDFTPVKNLIVYGKWNRPVK